MAMRQIAERLQPIETMDEWCARLPGLAELRSLTHGDSRVRIAVLDGAVKINGEAASFTDGGASGHGKLVTSIISDIDKNIRTGLAPNCVVENIDIYSRETADYRDADPSCSHSDLANHIRRAIRQGFNIINISASELREPEIASRLLAEAISDAVASDILVIAAVGNQGSSGNSIPASFPGVLAVGALDAEGMPLASNNWGPWLRYQGVLAPGSSLPGACPDGGLCRGTGSSFATAAVTGVAALLMSAALAQGREVGGSRIRRLLIDTAEPCDPTVNRLCGPFLAGKLNVAKAVKKLIKINAEERRGNMMENSEVERRPNRTDEIQMQSTVSPPGIAAQDAMLRAASSAAAGVRPAQCDCGGGGDPQQLVYAFGTIGIGFASEARRDSIWRKIHANADNTSNEYDLKPLSSAEIADLLTREPYIAESLVWTLNRSGVPMYAIRPMGAYAADAYKLLVDDLREQNAEKEEDRIDYVSVPGVAAGKTRLSSGAEVDVLVPDIRGMWSWSMEKLKQAIIKASEEKAKARKGTQVRTEKTGAEKLLTDKAFHESTDLFFGKILYRLRNLGRTPEERALNSAVTEAYHFSDLIYELAHVDYKVVLKDVSVEKSPVDRPGSLYYDVLLTFFDPGNRSDGALLLARYTMDVSDTIPVLVGRPHIWHEY